VERTREELGQLVARLAARPNLTEAVREQGRLKEKAEELAREVARSTARGEAAREAAPAKLLPGARVKVVPLGREAEVVEVTASDALVAMGPLKTRVKLADLVALAGAPRAPPTSLRSERSRRAERAEAAAPAPLIAREAQVDVRGLRAEEALREVELFLDRSYAEGQATVRILHGHGTGALKKALREALQGSPYVATFRPGEAHEGGDGVTLVAMRE
jgi:DNA mismatch repair protein MutS2